MNTDSNLKCIRCGGEMEEGFVVSQHGIANLRLFWVPGEPQPSFLSGTKVEQSRDIVTLRCVECGRLEEFA